MSSQNDDDRSEFQSRADLFIKNRVSAQLEPVTVSKGLITHGKETNQIEFEKDQDITANDQKRVPKGLPQKRKGDRKHTEEKRNKGSKHRSQQQKQIINFGGKNCQNYKIVEKAVEPYGYKLSIPTDTSKKNTNKEGTRKNTNIQMKGNTSEKEKNSIEIVDCENPSKNKNQQEEKPKKSFNAPEKKEISSYQKKQQMIPEKEKNLKIQSNRSWIKPEVMGQKNKQSIKTPQRKKKQSNHTKRQQMTPEKYEKESQIQNYSSSKKLLSKKELFQVQQINFKQDKKILIQNKEKEKSIRDLNQLRQRGNEGTQMGYLPQEAEKHSNQREKEVLTSEQLHQSVNKELQKVSQSQIKRESIPPESLDHPENEEEVIYAKASQLLTKREEIALRLLDHSVHEEDNIFDKTLQPLHQRKDEQLEYSVNEERHFLDRQHQDKREKEVITPESLENKAKILGLFPGNTLHIEDSELMENEQFCPPSQKKLLFNCRQFSNINSEDKQSQDIHDAENDKDIKSSREDKYKNNQNICSEQNTIQESEISLRENFHKQPHDDKSNSDGQQQNDHYFRPITQLSQLKSQLHSKIRRKDGLEMELQIDQRCSKYFSPQYTLKFYSEREEEKRVLMRAKKTSSFPCSTFIITCQEGDFKEGSPSYLGTIKSNVFGDVFNVFGPGISLADAKKNKKGQPRELLATIVFTRQYIPTGLPRRFSVYIKKKGCRYQDFQEVKQKCQQIPLHHLYGSYMSEKKSSEEGSLNPIQQLIQKNKSSEINYSVEDKIVEDKDQEKIDLFHNRKPKWIEGCRAYMLKLGKKGKQPSTKNFILEDSNDGRELVLLSKDSDKKFYMKMGPPLSPFVAFAVALSNFSKRLIGQ